MIADAHPHRGHGLLVPLALGSAALVALLLAPVGAQGPTICPFALLTGTACPGCGMTRALVALAHGRPAEAWQLHPLAPLVMAGSTLWYGWWAAARAGLVRPWPRALPVTVSAATGVLLVGVWVLRLLAGTLPPV